MRRLTSPIMKLAIVLLPIVATIASAADAKPLQYRVWQFQDYNMDHIKRMIDIAARHKVNRVQLSHEIVMKAEQVLDRPQLASDINTICHWAHAKGIKVDLWTHELSGVPEEFTQQKKGNLDNPKLWEWVAEKYRKLFSACPKLDGLVLTMHETAMSVYSDNKVISSLPKAKRVAKLIDTIYEVCKPIGKLLIVRTFAYEPGELNDIQAGLNETKADIVVMSKCCPHDWQPYYPFGPDIGNVGGRPQLVEFDLGNEFTGLSTIPYVNFSYLKKNLDYDLTKKIVGSVLRIERLKWRAVDTPNQGVIEVFTAMLANPKADPFKLYEKWLADRYDAKAAPLLLSAFKRTEEIIDKGLFVLGFWITDHSRLPTYEYAKDHLHWLTTAKWNASPYWKNLEQELFNPTPATLTKISKEKDRALALVEASIADVKKAKPYLRERDYDYLIDLFKREKAMVVVWKAATEVIFGIDVYKRDKSEANAAYLRAAADRLDKVANDNAEHLIRMASDYANMRRMENVGRAHGLAKYAREVLEEK